MAKSPLIGKMNNRVISSENIIELPSMVIEIQNPMTNRLCKLDLEKLKYRNCNIDQGFPEVNRDNDIIKIASYFHKHITKTRKLFSLYYYLCDLIITNDKSDTYPFSKDGLINLSKYLWIKVQSFDPLKKLWNYNHDDFIGVRESSAASQLSKTMGAMSDILDHAGTDLWLTNEKPLNHLGGRESYDGYDSNELYLSTRRLTLYFTQLAKKLIEFKRSGDTEDCIKVSLDGSEWLVPVTVKGRKELSFALSVQYCKDTAVLSSRAFNQAMVAAYYLLSYFTAFNTSPLLGLRKPLTITESKAEEWYQLDAYKGRSSSNVEALLGGKAHKKSCSFIKLLVSLSDAYNEDGHGLLLYSLNNTNTPRQLTEENLLRSNISDILDLSASKKNQCVKHLCSIYEKLVNRYQIFDFRLPTYRSVQNRLNISEKEARQGAIATRISTLAFAIIDAVKLEENISLTGIVLPIGIEDRGEVVDLSFRYVSGKLGNITIPSKYLYIVEKQLEFAFSQSRSGNRAHKGTHYDYTAMRVRKKHFISPLDGYNPMYFIPFGAYTAGFKQWEGLSPLLKKILYEFGIRSGDYLMDLNSSRMRETNAMIVRAQKGTTVNNIATILQNSLQTVLNNYGEDNKQQNFIITSQGLQVIQEIFTDLNNNEKGISKEALEHAKKIVKEKLKIDVLEHDQYLELGRQQNGIGMYCNSPYDPEKTRKITREADKANLLNKGEVLACHDYIDCVLCAHSKLINDVAALYRLLSFINLLEEFRIFHLTEAHYQLNFGDTVLFLQELINAKIPKNTVSKAKLQLEKQGRHPAWDDIQLVEQFIL